MSSDITVSQLRDALPKTMQNRVSQELIDSINGALVDPSIREDIRDNILGYTSVMQEGKFKIENYISAVRYISYKVMGATNVSAYSKTFPTKIQDWVARQVDEKDISAYVSGYNKSKLVNLIYAQTLIPTHILNADVFQEAINEQVKLMRTAKSETVRTTAADSLLKHLKAPEAQKTELSISLIEDDSIRILRETTQLLAQQQLKALQTGNMNITDVAHSTLKIADAEVVDG